MTKSLSIQTLRAAGLSEADAERLTAYLVRATATDAAAGWSLVSREALAPSLPHAVHRFLYDTIFAVWDGSHGPRPAWTPTREEAAATNIAAACRRRGLAGYADLHRWSVRHRAEFWRDTIDALTLRFRTPPAEILDASRGVAAARWLAGARLNITESCFLSTRDATAIVSRSEDGSLARLSYGELDALSNRFANALRSFGAGPGAAVAIAMPMAVEAVVAYLGIVKAGCVVVSVADSFAADEIRTRLRIAGAQIAVTQDVVVRAGKTLPMAQKVFDAGARACIVVPHAKTSDVTLRAGDRSWDAFLSPDEAFDVHPGAPDDATNILFSSGTTGDPKAIPWSHATPIKCAMDGHYHHDIHPGDVVAWPTNLGWMMGPWLIYASLINRATMALSADAPNTPAFCRFVQDARVTMLGVVPSIVKAWRAGGMTDGVDWTSLRAFSSTGEASNADDYLWLMARARYKPVVEYCGGTEIGGGYITQALTQAASPATFSTPSLGLDVRIMDERGNPAHNGELFIVPPSIGLSHTLLNRDHDEVYHAGTPKGPVGETLRRHGDQMEMLPAGYYRAHGRADDTMNLGGIKVSSAEIERVLLGVEGLTDVAAIAVDPADGGPSLLVLYVAGAGLDAAAVKSAAQKSIAARLNPLFRVHDVRVVDSLPRTASNKVMRRVLREQYPG
ncbi:MAG TPA: AMP-binding protein [Candidatus Krumholzibacteria bacterium]|nr:AMP-binding protein [Candidatus Krumholzibacteria bacterium]